MSATLNTLRQLFAARGSSWAKLMAKIAEDFPLAPARGPPTGWAELVQAHDDRDAIQASPHDLPVIDIREP